MIETIIELLASNKEVIGAVVGIGEGIVVLINIWKKLRKKKSGGVEPMAAPPSFFKSTLWVLNPINIFRSPK